MEKFTAATGTGTALVDLDGTVLVASGWQDICTRFHRGNPDTLKRCNESDVSLANSLEKGEKYNIYRCLNGMVDVAIPITIQGSHVANIFIGQFLSKKPDIEFFRQQARKYGFNEKEYLLALSKVPVLTDEEVKLKMEYLAAFALFLAEAGLNKIRLQELMQGLEDRIEERTRDLKDAQIATLNMMQDAEEARQQAQKANENLARSNTELEQFAYVASHDLQEPLRMVASYVQLLERRYKDKLDQDALDFIGYAVDGAGRMKVLINDLLSFSRVQTQGKPFENIKTEDALKEVTNNLKYLIEESGAVITHAPLPEIHADKGQIEQLLQNLISNAIKYCNDDKPRIDISVNQANEEWVFSITDNGIGIDPQFFDRIFIIFQRLHGKDAYSGTGIGLAICKKIVERHGGKIWVESEPGKGATFYFTLSGKQTIKNEG
jgi:signal transduction histidine kinase